MKASIYWLSTMCQRALDASFTGSFVNSVLLSLTLVAQVRTNPGSETCLKTGQSGLGRDLSPACLKVVPFFSHPLALPPATRAQW